MKLSDISLDAEAAELRISPAEPHLTFAMKKVTFKFLMQYGLALSYPKFEDVGAGSIEFTPFDFEISFNPARNPENGNFELELKTFFIDLDDIKIHADSGTIMKYIDMVINYIKEGLMAQLTNFLKNSLMATLQPILTNGLE